jgi:hypothetical protein
MAFWTGTHWEPPAPMRKALPRPSRTRHVAGAVSEGALIALLVVGLIAGSAAAAGRKSSEPTLSVSTSSARTIDSGGGALTVRGNSFTPSSGGQVLSLWVGYPDDYCAPDRSVCHGFYAHPWVNDDGSFDVTYADVLMQSGTGVVKAIQYNVRTDKWRTVAKENYTAP